MPARGTHRGWQLAPEKKAQTLERVGARAVNRQEGAKREILEVEQQVAVEGDGARDRQRRERCAIEDGQPLQLVERKPAHAMALDPIDQSFELAPALRPPLAELAALEHELGLAGGGRSGPRR